LAQDPHVQDIAFALAASPNYARDQICFAGYGSGLYRSEDGGTTWQYAYQDLNPPEPLATLAVAVSPDFERDRAVFAGVAGGVLRSVDGGKGWQVAAFASASSPLVCSLVISPAYARDGTLLAGTFEDGVFRSANRGHNWTAWNFGLLDLSVLGMAISPGFGEDETLFVATESGVYTSTNAGRAWREVEAFAPQWAPVLSLALSPGYPQDGTLFAGTESRGLLRSRDRGANWEQLGDELAVDAVNITILSPEYPDKPDLLVLVGNRLLISRDDGQSWSDWGDGVNIETDVASVIAPLGLDPGAPLLVGLAEGGVLAV
jgi:photosystem II stability/assembly factor-like uncharacterized protein